MSDFISIEEYKLQNSGKKKRNNEEDLLQIECFAWFKETYPELDKLLIHVANERESKGIYKKDGTFLPIQKFNFAKKGVVAGVSDFLLLIPAYRTDIKPVRIVPYLCIELKSKKGVHRPSQKEFMDAVRKVGAIYVLVRTFENFKKVIHQYLKYKT